MVTEKDLPAINDALMHGFDIHIRTTKEGYKIVAERTKAKVLKDSKRE